MDIHVQTLVLGPMRDSVVLGDLGLAWRLGLVSCCSAAFRFQEQ